MINVWLENLNRPRIGLNDHPGQLDEDVGELGRGRYLFLPLLNLSGLNRTRHYLGLPHPDIQLGTSGKNYNPRPGMSNWRPAARSYIFKPSKCLKLTYFGIKWLLKRNKVNNISKLRSH
jgi:hypothetical protein